MSNKYKISETKGLFAESFRLEKLSKQGGPLELLNKVVDWNFFRATAENMINNNLPLTSR